MHIIKIVAVAAMKTRTIQPSSGAKSLVALRAGIPEPEMVPRGEAQRCADFTRPVALHLIFQDRISTLFRPIMQLIDIITAPESGDYVGVIDLI